MLLQNVADKVAIKNVGWFPRILANIKIAKTIMSYFTSTFLFKSLSRITKGALDCKILRSPKFYYQIVS